VTTAGFSDLLPPLLDDVADVVGNLMSRFAERYHPNGMSVFARASLLLKCRMLPARGLELSSLFGADIDHMWTLRPFFWLSPDHSLEGFVRILVLADFDQRVGVFGLTRSGAR